MQHGLDGLDGLNGSKGSVTIRLIRLIRVPKYFRMEGLINHPLNFVVEKVNITEKLSAFNDYFNPRIVGELNGQQVKLVKFKGEFVWHHHEQEDELFYVIKGRFDMQLHDKTITVNAGEFLIIPRGVEHRPVARDEVEIMLFEPATTLNTGNTENKLTRKELEYL